MLTGDILRQTALRSPHKDAVRSAGRVISYNALDRLADRIANAVLDLRLPRGSVAAILSNNQLEYPAIFFGLARTPHILAHLSARYTTEDLIYVLNKTGASLIFVYEDFLPLVNQIRARVPTLKHIVAFGPKRAYGDALPFDRFIEGGRAIPPAVSIAANDPFAITFTGGTTGFPKAVCVTHKQRVASAHMAAAEFGLRADDVFSCVTPLFHVAGIFSWYLTGVLVGGTFAFAQHWDPAQFVDQVQRERITAGFMVPTMVNMLVAHEAATPDALKHLRYLNFGGSPMPAAMLERAMRKLPHIQFMEHYGQSEAGVIAVRPSEFNAGKADSIGRAFRGLELQVHDAHGRKLAPGEIGEIVVLGPGNLHGYYNDDDQTALLYNPAAPGWLRTGDVGMVDAEGFIFLVDRSKDMIISGGENIYPTEIENALFQHDAVAECAVFGVPDATWGEVPAAHVVLKPGVAATEAELIEFCAARIPRHKRPRVVKFVPSLPKTAIGKIQKNVLREPYWRDQGRRI